MAAMRSYAAPMLFVAFNAMAYGVYMAVDGLDQIGRWSTPQRPLPIGFIVFHIAFALMWISYIRLILTPPGSVPSDHIWTCSAGDGDDQQRFALSDDELELMGKIAEPGFYPFTEPLRDRVRRLPFVEIKAGRSGALRRCGKCVPAHYKPDRTHHCSRTDTCVLVMDHYCTFAHTTIGLGNRKFFVLFLLYALSSLIAYLIIMARPLHLAVDHVLDGIVIHSTDAAVILVCIVAATLTAGLALFFAFHIYILLHCMTTIEFREKHQSRDEDVRRRSAIANVKYDAGYWANMTAVFGAPILVWPLPIRGGGPGIGPYDGLGVDPKRLVALTAKPTYVTQFA